MKLFYLTLAATAALIALKLIGASLLSWWWVTSPLWVPILYAFGLVAAYFYLARKYRNK